MMKVSEFAINLFYTESPFNNIFINMSSGCRPSTKKPQISNAIAYVQAIAYIKTKNQNQTTIMQEHGR